MSQRQTNQTDPTGTTRPGGAGSEGFDVAGKHLYLIGIGGCGMSGLARLLRSRGAIVSGSDKEESETTAALIAESFEVGFDQSAAALPEACELVVASAAVKHDHPQVLAAADRGIKVLTYAEALGKCMIGTSGVAIAGTHGKSSTVAMLGHILIQSGLDPSVIVGATCSHLMEEPAGGNSSTNESAEKESRKTASPHPALSQGEREQVTQAAGRTPQAAAAGFRIGAATIPQGPMNGAPGILVAEACEFNRSFHNFHPTIGAITSVEADHLDIYGSLDAVIESFHQFARQIAAAADGGRLLISHDGAHRRHVTAGLACDVKTIGYNPAADYHVTCDLPTRTVCLREQGKPILSWTFNVPGEHMAMNSAFAALIALWLGADPRLISAALATFRGVDRRMQFLGVKAMLPSPRGAGLATRVRGLHLIHDHGTAAAVSSESVRRQAEAGAAAGRGSGVAVYDDYGHHPTEIDCTLRALREFEKPETRGGRLICVFQPHQHSRTRHLLDEFAQSFSHADVVIVPHIYFVRDSEIEKTKVSSADLVDRLRKRGVHAMHLYPFEAIVEQLQNLCRPGDLLVVMGAGPVWQVAHAFMRSGN
ncbi:MAG TPA: Mur ligase domain-containing protein [Phycisphaerales bacterium]|nr:Mur ligase domain-containing protein [Phycisphaerales bacterium]